MKDKEPLLAVDKVWILHIFLNRCALFGFVFLSHQIGSFFGVWLGGKLYDLTGGYTTVWWIGVGVGAFSALVHLPIREKPLMGQAA